MKRIFKGMIMMVILRVVHTEEKKLDKFITLHDWIARSKKLVKFDL